MAVLIYLLCALTCLASAALLLRGYQRMRHRLLFWSGLCFASLTVANVVLMLDKVVFVDVDMSTARLSITLFSLAVLLYGLIWEGE